MISDNLSLKGRLNIVVTSPDGEIKDQKEIDNLVVTTSLHRIKDRNIYIVTTINIPNKCIR